MSRQQQPPQPLWLHINLNKSLGATADLRCESRPIYVPNNATLPGRFLRRHMEAISFSFKIYKMTDEIPPHGASWLSIVIVYSSCASLVNLWNSRHTEGNPSHLSMQWWPSLWPKTGVGNGQGCLRDIAFLVDLCPQGKTSFKHLTMKNCYSQSLQNREVLRIACEQFLMYLYISHEKNMCMDNVR